MEIYAWNDGENQENLVSIAGFGAKK